MMKTWLVPMCPQSCLSPSLTSQLSASCTFALTLWSMKGDYDGHEALMMIEIDIFTQVRVLDSKCTYFADMIWYYVVISIFTQASVKQGSATRSSTASVFILERNVVSACFKKG